MSPVLQPIWHRLETEPPQFDHDQILEFDPDGSLRSRWLREIAPSRSSRCRGCDQLEPVQMIQGPRTGKVRAFACCSQCGPQPINTDSLRRWTVDVEKALDQVAAAASIAGRRTGVVEGHLWRLGTVTLAKRSREVYFLRRYLLDVRPVVDEALRTHPAALVLVATGTDTKLSSHLTMPLESVLTTESGRLSFDARAVEDLVESRPTPSKSRPAKALSRRASRMTSLEQLQNELIDHLRSAKEHAWQTLQSGRTPELLPRPTQEQLGRAVSLNPSTVSRCFSDQNGNLLRMLWDLAGDLPRLMQWKNSDSR